MHYFQLMSDLAAHYGFDLDTPFKDLSEPMQHLILEGGGSEVVAFHDTDSEGATRTRRYRFEGVIPNLKRRYRDTESNLVRER